MRFCWSKLITNERHPEISKMNAHTRILPSFVLFSMMDVRKVNPNCVAPNRAEAVPASVLKCCSANVVAVGNNIPNGATKKNSGIICT